MEEKNIKTCIRTDEKEKQLKQIFLKPKKIILPEKFEDPIMVYKIARLAAELNLCVEKPILKLMENTKNELIKISNEKLFQEFYIILGTKKPSIFFDTLKEANVLDVHFKEIYDLIGALQPIEYHPEGDAYNHTMLALDKAAELTTSLKYRFCTLVHDLGKGVTPKEEYPHHRNHGINGVPLVEDFGKKLGIPYQWVKCGQIACKEHMQGGRFYKMNLVEKIEFIKRNTQNELGIHGLQIVVYADKCSRGLEDNELFKKVSFENFLKLNTKLN